MTTRIRAVIFGSIQPGTIEIHVAYGYGLADGGSLHRVDRNIIPVDCRLPNTYVWVTIQDNDIRAVEKMTSQEVDENKII